eukprot:m.311226 g.311226  ORF g.311226 m.311226 type:complete len:89 (-) comp19651_c1_seq4:2634-2900(-)
MRSLSPLLMRDTATLSSWGCARPASQRRKPWLLEADAPPRRNCLQLACNCRFGSRPGHRHAASPPERPTRQLGQPQWQTPKEKAKALT